jgi:hypothetical protein
MLDTIEPASLLPDGSFYLAQKKLKIGVDAEGKLTLQRGKYHDRTKGFAAEGRLAVVEEVSRRDFAAAEERNGLAWKRATERHLAEQRAQAAEEASGDGGMFGALVGAAVGAYAGAASGMDTADTLGLMMQGAAAVSPDSAVAQGFADGWAEETAKNEAMAQSFEHARDRGLAEGAAEYARRQNGAGTGGLAAGSTGSAGMVIEARGEAPAPAASAPPSAERGTSSKLETYVYCVAYARDSKTAYFSDIIPTHGAMPPDVARAYAQHIANRYGATRGGFESSPACNGTSGSRDGPSVTALARTRENGIARDGRMFEIVDVPFSYGGD